MRRFLRNCAAISIGALFVVTLLVFAVAVGRGSSSDLTEPGDDSTTAAATPTPVAQEPTPTPTAEPTATPTSTPEPTPTPPVEPDPTPAPSPTPEPTPEPLDPPYLVACAADEPVDDPELAALISAILGEQEPYFAVVVHDLTTGRQAEVNADQTFYGASLFKLGIMYEVMRQVDNGLIDLDQSMLITDYYAQQDLGTLELLGWSAGTEITVIEALDAMITVSDNATAIMLGDLVGWLQMDETLAALGAVETEFSSLDLWTTAADISVILNAIACGTGVDDVSAQLMLDLLSKQTITDRLPRDLPTGIVVGHKTGNWSDVNHDAGIVYGNDATFLITVLSSSPGGSDVIARLSRTVYDYFHEPDSLDDSILE